MAAATPRRTIGRLLTPLALAILAACSAPTVGVDEVRIVGGDRTLPLDATALLTAVVTAHGGAVDTVAWSSSQSAVASVDENGLVTPLALGATTITATSTDDASRSDSVVITVVAEADDASRVPGTLASPDGSPPALGVGLLLLEFGAMLTDSVTEVAPGIYVGPLSPVDSDGSFELVLPVGSHLPAGLFSSADEFVVNLWEAVDCTLTASDPSVRVTRAAFELVTFPGIGLATTQGLGFAIATDEPIDDLSDESALFAADFATWVYADAPVHVTTTGAGCASPGETMSVDVTLATGWNALAWSVVYDDVAEEVTGLELRDADGEDLFVFGPLL